MKDVFLLSQVLQSDGGNYCASVNAATLALMDAGIPMKDYVIACSGSHLRDTPIVDMNHLEESSGGAEVIMAVLPRCDQVSYYERYLILHIYQIRPAIH